MRLSLAAYDARRLSESTAPSTGWPVETWVIHPKGEPGAPVVQVQLFREGGVWCLWTGNITRAETRTLGHQLAGMRNPRHMRRTMRHSLDIADDPGVPESDGC